MPKFVIDTCSLTKMRHTYPQDVFPSAWTKLTELAEKKSLISAEDIYEELKAFDDEILQWAEDQDDFFYPLDQDVQKIATTILTQYPGVIDLKKNKSSADPFLIATAIHTGCIVVTEEKPSNSPTKIKIPTVCQALDVECINILEMFRRESLKI